MFQAGGGANSFSHKAPPCSTDLRCYFQCPEAFKKDVDLRIHLKLRHRNEPEAELRRAYQAAEEEIALVKRSASVFQCALCTKKVWGLWLIWWTCTKGSQDEMARVSRKIRPLRS